jgi:hypothetical protein
MLNSCNLKLLTVNLGPKGVFGGAERLFYNINAVSPRGRKAFTRIAFEKQKRFNKITT